MKKSYLDEEKRKTEHTQENTQHATSHQECAKRLLKSEDH